MKYRNHFIRESLCTISHTKKQQRRIPIDDSTRTIPNDAPGFVVKSELCNETKCTDQQSEEPLDGENQEINSPVYLLLPLFYNKDVMRILVKNS